jgi:hypothetical protein
MNLLRLAADERLFTSASMRWRPLTRHRRQGNCGVVDRLKVEVDQHQAATPIRHAADQFDPAHHGVAVADTGSASVFAICSGAAGSAARATAPVDRDWSQLGIRAPHGAHPPEQQGAPR